GTTNGHLACVRIKDGSDVWRVKLADSGLTGPVVVGTSVVVAAEEGALIRASLDDGHRLWRQTDLGELTLQPVVTPSHVRLAEGKGLASFALANGNPGAPYSGDQLWSGEPTLVGAWVVIGTRGGPLSVLDCGQLALRYRLGGSKASSAPPVSTGTGHVI